MSNELRNTVLTLLVLVAMVGVVFLFYTRERGEVGRYVPFTTDSPRASILDTKTGRVYWFGTKTGKWVIIDVLEVAKPIKK